ncbi:MAG: hypothetical protein C0462_04480 [Alcanivorax sp.]|nr:hypothetical protein [Alcanivorax sp.]
MRASGFLFSEDQSGRSAFAVLAILSSPAGSQCQQDRGQSKPLYPFVFHDYSPWECGLPLIGQYRIEMIIQSQIEHTI